jgi:ComF family protein
VGLQAVLQWIYPPQCLGCDALVTTDFGLCGPCWRDTPFITGLVCDACGIPLPGDDTDMGGPAQCDACLALARPWAHGRAALLYKDIGRKMVLQLKHGDRLDLAKPAGGWLLQAAKPLLRHDTLIAPIPLHWLRLVKRRYNQSALLSASLARAALRDHCPDLLIRRKRTPSQQGRDRHARFENLQDAIVVHPRRAARVQGRPVLLVDDVMTSGATLTVAAEACLAAGASEVCVVVLARVAKDD